jgi:hypothetical protein
MIQLDTDYLFRQAGGVKGLLLLMAKHRQDEGLEVATMQMWKTRHRIPSQWLPPILYVLHQEGHELISFFNDVEFAI